MNIIQSNGHVDIACVFRSSQSEKVPNQVNVYEMNVYDSLFSKKTNKCPCLSNPHGPLSKRIPSSCIEAANKQVSRASANENKQTKEDPADKNEQKRTV